LFVFAVALWLVIKVLPEQLASTGGIKDPSKHAEEIGRTRTAVLASLAGVLAAVGAYYTHRTFGLNRQGQITERFTRAVDQLGNLSLDVRLGGIYAVERLARESRDDHGPIIEILTAYIREHTQPSNQYPTSNEDNSPAVEKRVATDVQAALTVLGRRTLAHDPSEPWRVDLGGAHLERARLDGAHLEGARLSDAHLERATLDGAHLKGANLVRAYFEGANLGGAHLEGANLGGAHLEGANLGGAHLEGANLGGAHLEGANLGGAHLEGANLSGAHLEKARLSGAHLEEANLSGAHLEEANLVRTHLEKARLAGVHLEGAKLAGAHLEEANLTNAHLGGALLAGATWSNATEWPDGFNPGPRAPRVVKDSPA
jgi:uncharacterized protein YjbI with pentapeptide repeats